MSRDVREVDEKTLTKVKMDVALMLQNHEDIPPAEVAAIVLSMLVGSLVVTVGIAEAREYIDAIIKMAIEQIAERGEIKP